MNKFFIQGEGRRDFPKRGYGKLDQIEILAGDGRKTRLISIDLVDANWKGFEGDGLFSLNAGPIRDVWLRNLWSTRFSGKGGDEDAISEAFDDLPMYHLELTIDESHPWSQRLNLVEDKWVEIELDGNGDLPVDVFGGLFMDAVPAFMVHPPRPTPLSPILNTVFGMELWPDTDAQTLGSMLNGCEATHLLTFDVGQGAANGIACPHDEIQFYFDVGCGVYRNHKTRPTKLTFCTHDEPTVILSHWDADHWAAATVARNLLALNWIAPRQSISHIHTALGNDILKAGGHIAIIPTHLCPHNWVAGSTTFELQACTGTTRNGSGLALFVRNPSEGRSWLLTGDAAYDEIPGPLTDDFAAVVVPHHGADMGTSSVPPTMQSNYSRLMYSFGVGNAHGRTAVQHPTQAAMDAHELAGWHHGSWLPTQPGDVIAGQPVLATAAHTAGRLDGAVAGWSAPPSLGSLTGHLWSCSDVMPLTQT